MRTAVCTLDPAFTVGALDRRIFGSFVEHMGRCVYTGVYEPEHPTADDAGFRGDVLALTRELGVSVVRYPGGNFVSSYRWEDGVGPVEERPTRLDLAWRAIEPNEVGVNELLGWAKNADVEPMLAVNLGTRGVQEACDLLEYCNHPEGTYWSDLRRSHGVKEPYGVRLWCLGNELDGPWQVGAKTPYEYGRLAAETAKAMRLVDPSVELVAVGSSNSAMPTFGTWETEVLTHTYPYVDYVSLHQYYDDGPVDRASFLASAVDMDRFIESVTATADAVGARLRSPRRLKLSFDEWNVWFQSRFHGAPTLDWQFARDLIEDTYDVADAVVVGSLLISLLRHADRIGVACQAQLVNVIAPIRTEPGGPAWRQTIFHPFAQAARLARGDVLRVELRGPVQETSAYGDADLVYATATHDPESGDLAVLAVNRDETEPLLLEADVRALGALTVAEHQVLADDDPTATNTRDNPQRVEPRHGTGAEVTDGTLRLPLPPLSWTVLRLTPARSSR